MPFSSRPAGTLRREENGPRPSARSPRASAAIASFFFGHFHIVIAHDLSPGGQRSSTATTHAALLMRFRERQLQGRPAPPLACTSFAAIRVPAGARSPAGPSNAGFGIGSTYHGAHWLPRCRNRRATARATRTQDPLHPGAPRRLDGARRSGYRGNTCARCSITPRKRRKSWPIPSSRIDRTADAVVRVISTR
jgi:hypothetical protein